jgi:chitin synthase
MVLSGPGPLITAYGQNGVEELRTNVTKKILQAHAAYVAFVDEEGRNASIVADGVALASVVYADNTNTVALLRGGKFGGLLGMPNKAGTNHKNGKTGDTHDQELLLKFDNSFGSNTAYIASPTFDGTSASNRTHFAINHHSGAVRYDVTDFIARCGRPRPFLCSAPLDEHRQLHRLTLS